MASRLCPYCRHSNRGADPFCARCQTLLPPAAVMRGARLKAAVWFSGVSLLFGCLAFFAFADGVARNRSTAGLAWKLLQSFFAAIVLPWFCAGVVGAKWGAKVITDSNNGTNAAWYGFFVAVLSALAYANMAVIYFSRHESLPWLEFFVSTLGIDLTAIVLGAIILGPFGAFFGWLLFRITKTTPPTP
jgi:hypothetical protein